MDKWNWNDTETIHVFDIPIPPESQKNFSAGTVYELSAIKETVQGEPENLERERENQMIPQSDDDQLIVLAAFRHCLGRDTYMPRMFVDWAKNCWKDFTAKTKDIIARDINDAINSKWPLRQEEVWRELLEMTNAK